MNSWANSGAFSSGFRDRPNTTGACWQANLLATKELLGKLHTTREFDGGVFLQLRQHALRRQPVDRDQRHGFRRSWTPSQGEIRDVDAVLPKHGANVTNHARYVLILHEDYKTAQRRFAVDAVH